MTRINSDQLDAPWPDWRKKQMTEAIRLKPDFSLALCNRAFANFQLNRYDDAIADYAVALDHEPKLTYCYFGRGTLYLTIGE